MAIIFKDKKKQSKVDHNHNYGGFWMDRGAAAVEMDGRTGASSMVKALKLRNYQRAIANFVKILSQKDVPVTFAGTDSYTDSKSVTIAANVNDKNFDITAGLALHEASHIKHTDFQVLTDYLKGHDDYYIPLKLRRVKDMLNWIEDRRIDTLVFKSSPGYKAYYHKLYDHYFRSKEISKMLRGDQFRAEVYDNYEAHIINMMNSEFNKYALEVLPQVVALIDVNNISRLKNTADALELAKQVVTLIETHLQKKEEEQQQQTGSSQENPQQESDDQEMQDSMSGDNAPTGEKGEDDGEGGSDSGEAGEDDGSTAEGGEAETEKMTSGNSAGGSGSGGSDGSDDGEGGQEDNTASTDGPLTSGEMAKISKALEEQKKMIDGEVDKKKVAKNMKRKLEQIQNSEAEVAAVGEGTFKTDCVIYRLDKETNMISTLYGLTIAKDDLYNKYREASGEERDKLHDEYYKAQRESDKYRESISIPIGLGNRWNSNRTGTYVKAIAEGMQLGAVLGRKLQTRRETKELVTNRLRTGKIDARRIAHAGYGIENIFNQIHIDKYKKAIIHITLDASGSMGGDRWKNTVKMTMALGKAISMIDGLEFQVSTRETEGSRDSAVVAFLYDSRINKLNHLRMVLEMYNANSMTPEGLCLEALIKRKLITPTTGDQDSYLINICDGAPGAGSYGGHYAVSHTQKQMRRINQDLGVKHVGFFFGEDGYGGFGKFKQMYGTKESIALPDANNATAIANHMNKELMKK